MNIIDKINRYLNEKITIRSNVMVFIHQIKKFSMHLERDVINDNIEGLKTSIAIIEDNIKNLKKKL
jgi:predicted translin family RNA/ssDNA-binding protein